MPKKLSPAQQQYADLKEQHADALLFFRLGDFYEVFYDDAKIAHDVLGITLTARNKTSPDPIPMAWVPHHSAQKYIKKLLEAGYKVALAEQVGQVVPGKIVERKVVEILTPGTAIEEQSQATFLAALSYVGGWVSPYHLAWGDISLGKYVTESFKSTWELFAKIYDIAPREIILPRAIPERDSMSDYLTHTLWLIVSFHDGPYDADTYIQQWTKTTHLSWYGQALTQGRQHALALLFSYIEQLHQEPQIVHIRHETPQGKVLFDATTRDNLEIFRSGHDGSTRHSLFGVINHTKTSMGSRLLHDRLLNPITDLQELESRLDLIHRYEEHAHLISSTQSVLQHLSDVPRLITKIITKKPSCLAAQQLLHTLQHIFTGDTSTLFLWELTLSGLSKESVSTIQELFIFLEQAVQDELVRDDHGYIRDGYNEDVDRLRKTAFHSDELLLAYQQEVIEHSGIKVKLKYIRNQWYAREVTPKDAEKFEQASKEDDDKFFFIRGQTLKTGQRYMTWYLSTLEQEIHTAQEALIAKEYDLLLEIITSIHTCYTSLMECSDSIAVVDLSTSMAQFAQHHERIKPTMHDGKVSEISKGRHPVVEAFLPSTEQFIPNDLLQNEQSFFHIITGPNMGGKSTFLRQNALIYLLAHAGLYVPASSAKIPLIDGLFARVGAGDALSKNQSTFMTEMLEMANIIHHATDRSFVVLDELGRGTSTYDGLALAKAISVYMCQDKNIPTLFATHYHELTILEEELPWCNNYSLSVYESDAEVVFLKKVVHGKASKSYGIDVATLAGIPSSIVQQAEQYLNTLEQTNITNIPKQSWFSFGHIHDTYKQQYDDLKALFDQVDINALTPIEALVLLQKIIQDYR